MKKTLAVLVITLSMCLALPYAKRYKKQMKQKSLNIAKKELQKTAQKPICVVIPSYNNELYYKKNLSSLFSQEYKNYRCIYVDDCSKDNTYELVKNYIKSNGQSNKCQLRRNTRNQGALSNLFSMIHSAKNDEIIVVLDGDDWFYNDQVLKNINAYYQNDDVWITYGQYIRHPDYQVGMCGPVTKSFLQKAPFRQEKWQYSHLRTFYAGLFKRIKLNDLLNVKKEFFDVTYDLAIMFPMLEMAREHAFFTPDISYVYNYETPNNDAKLRLKHQEDTEAYLRKQSAYPKLSIHPKSELDLISKKDQSDLVIFSFNRPMQLYACLESVQKHSKSLAQVSVIYRANTSKFDEGYALVKKEFPYVNFVKQSEKCPNKDFKPLVMKTSFAESEANYITYCVDDIILTDTIDWQQAIGKMQQTDAYGFYFRLGKQVNYCYMADQKQEIPKLIDLNDSTFAWGFKNGQYDWNYPNNVDLTLYKKSSIQKDLASFHFTYPNDMEGAWAAKFNKNNQIGLCYEDSKMINIPLNVVSKLQNPRNMQAQSPEELNKMFLSGYKIDIDAFYKIKNPSAHIALKPTFIART
jgi:glycosyltransferase involved in cell wall biosynthesis